ncbi:HNH endonuclease [Azospirillum tabaci]|uniref:HNH endonuclease n=1 Tax=Azospirillum tabaci TaxID=2752310 RepID=UPI0016602186|nr:HNH endonuclease [Azospirillum tabaci]
MAGKLRSLGSRIGTLEPRTGRVFIPAPHTEQDRKRFFDRQRGSAHQRGYDREWQKLRDAVVIERGCRCERCGTLVVLRKSEATATTPFAEVDHIESVQDRPDLRLERSNLRVLCRPCHSGRTARDQGFARRG